MSKYRGLLWSTKDKPPCLCIHGLRNNSERCKTCTCIYKHANISIQSWFCCTHSGFYEALDISKLSIIPASLRYMYQCSAKLLELWHLPWCLTNFKECDSIPENITNEFNGGCWWVIHVFGHSCLCKKQQETKWQWTLTQDRKERNTYER